MANRTFFLTLLTLLIVLLSEEVVSGLELALHSEGEVALNEYNIRCASGALLRPTVDCVVVIGERSLQVFELRADSLQVILDTEFDYARITAGPRTPDFAVGDFDSNERDEIVLCLNNQLMRFEWDGDEFGTKLMKFPYYIIDCVGGDVFGDGRKLLVTTSLAEPPSGPTKLRVNVSRFDSTGIDMVYDRTSDLNMTITTILPPDHLVCVGDIDNDGQTELVTSMAQSDVSPTRFRSYVWDADDLSFDLKDEFSFGDNALVRNVSQRPDWERELTSYVAGSFKPVALYGKTNLIALEAGRIEDCPLIQTENLAVRRRATMSHYGGSSAAVILTISDGVVSCRRFRNDDVISPSRVTYIEDSDGSDRGLLAVTHEYFDRPWPESEPVGWFRYLKLLDE